MTLRNHIYFWLGAFAAFLGLVWLFKGVLLPFVLGAAVAYLLDPLVEKLVKLKLSRTVATLIILGGFFVLLFGALALLLPLLYRELSQLATATPELIERLWTLAAPYTAWLQEHLHNGDFAAYQEQIKANAAKILQGGVGVLADGGGLIASGGQAVVNLVTLLVLMPVTAFFMMREWQTMTKWIDNLIPRKSYQTIKDLLEQINGKVAGFIRGQLAVAFALAVIYAVALMLAGLKYGFLIGLMAGVMSIIPMVGSTTGLVVAVAVAWFQSYEWSYTAMIAAIFLIGQFVEGNFLTPKLLGESVGLHPLWILFALMAGGAAFGIVGMLLAVPVAAVIGVLIGFAIKQYKASPFYEEKKKPAPKKKPVARKKAEAK